MTEPSKLTERLRGILNPAGTRLPVPQPPTLTCVEPHLRSAETSNLERVLGGQWRHDDHGSCFVVEKRLDPRARHGRAIVRDLAAALKRGGDDAPMIAGGAPARPPFVFFDLETTGLSGGAGTYAFLVGCGWFDEDASFVTRQYVLTELAAERSLLASVASALSTAGALVSFNGKSFDAPVLETRYLFHRMTWIGADVPHLDVLHSARRFWGAFGTSGQATSESRMSDAQPVSETAGCSLVALEQSVLGATRAGDVPGFEIPARYFRFVRSGDARPLAVVLEHNRLDLLSVAGLMSRLVELLRAGAPGARDAREALALGRAYWRAGLEPRARDAFSRALAMTEPAPTTKAYPCAPADPIRIAALRALALASRRARQFDEAAGYWSRLLDMCGCPAHVAREATEALAVHHEHRVRDLMTAKAFTLRGLESGARPSWHDAARHRLARIERKIADETRELMLELTD